MDLREILGRRVLLDFRRLPTIAHRFTVASGNERMRRQVHERVPTNTRRLADPWICIQPRF